MDDDLRRSLPESARRALERTEQFADSLIGQSEQDAVAASEAQGFAVRIAQRDGESFVLRADMEFSRVNLVIENGIVSEVLAS
jgi:hypothetical protein